ncbi:MAG TPA: alginate lyase family protein [Saprospiraceae bacterium]|nr:alginate lyase family protein [Saprospiraceae bacterium]
MWTKFSLYFHTLRHLRWQQIWYRLWYASRKRLFPTRLPQISAPAPAKLQFQPSLGIPMPIFQAPLTFTFLHQTHTFDPKIDWNFHHFGKLWTYNLTYFEFLNQEDISREQGLALVHDFIRQLPNIRDGLEPFPTSLRIIFWTRFLLQHDVQDVDINRILYQQLHFLHKNLEYHLLGNHLLENAFALLFGAVYFNDDKILRKAKKLLRAQLDEQILPDGAHFERSPMYHQLMLYRLLDCVNIVQNNSTSAADLLPFLQQKASVMLGWLKQMTLRNGAIPLVNDSAQGIAPTSQALFEYAERLGLKKADTALGASGYRRFANAQYELIVDAGDIGPDYIPGHAHCDTLSFVLHIGDTPFIVDTGTSTYEASARRKLERATAAHNTVQIGDVEQSEVWGAFRVARRARASILNETESSITATHDGYRRSGGQHIRIFRYENETITIEDKVAFNKEKLPAKAYLHFHPDVKIEVQDQRVLTESAVLEFENALKIEIATYFYAPEFNKTMPATVLTIWFEENLKTQIRCSPLAIREQQIANSKPRTANKNENPLPHR